MGDGFCRFVKRKRKLEEHRAKLACLTENIETCARGAFVFNGGGRLVGEALPEFGGEEERRVCGDLLDPTEGVVRADWLIERSIDFDGVEKLGEKCGFVKSF